MRHSIAAILAALAFAATSSTWADDVLVRVEYPLKTPRSRDPVLGGARDKVAFTVWIPEGVKAVRGAMCNPFAKGDSVSQHWAAMCRLWKFAYVQMDYDAVKKDEFLLLKTALADLAKKTGHPELEHVSLCYTGMSRGGGISMAMAELMPERTIACVPVCLEVGPSSDATRRIPVTTIFGEKDGSQMQKLLAKLPAERKLDARFAIAPQWGRRHEFALANNLSLPFLDDVIARRLPDEPIGNSPVPLRDIPLDSGWLGDPATWSNDGKRPTIQPYADYSGPRDQACWFPSRRTATVWQAFVSGSKDVVIAEPPGLGDKQPFRLHSSRKPIAVKVAVNAKQPAGKVELWNGDQRIAERTESPWTFDVMLPRGVHSLVAVVHDADRPARSSRPHTILVEE